jgi:hypothetical protein
MKIYLLVFLFFICIVITICYIIYKHRKDPYEKEVSNKHLHKIAILVISSSKKYDSNLETRWKKEKKIWIDSIKQKKNDNIDVFFMETDCNLPKNTTIIKNNTVYCGIQEDSYVPGILYKTMLTLKALPGYEFYVRTNLSTVVNYNALNKYLEKIPSGTILSTGKNNNYPLSEDFTKNKSIIVNKIKEKELFYYGNEHDNVWFAGWAVIFSKKYAHVLVEYFNKIPYILESKIADDVLISILIGKHNDDINDKCYEWWLDLQYYIYNFVRGINNNIIFHSCKHLSKDNQMEISKMVS